MFVSLPPHSQCNSDEKLTEHRRHLRRFSACNHHVLQIHVLRRYQRHIAANVRWSDGAVDHDHAWMHSGGIGPCAFLFLLEGSSDQDKEPFCRQIRQNGSRATSTRQGTGLVVTYAVADITVRRESEIDGLGYQYKPSASKYDICIILQLSLEKNSLAMFRLRIRSRQNSSIKEGAQFLMSCTPETTHKHGFVNILSKVISYCRMFMHNPVQIGVGTCTCMEVHYPIACQDRPAEKTLLTRLYHQISHCFILPSLVFSNSIVQQEICQKAHIQCCDGMLA